MPSKFFTRDSSLQTHLDSILDTTWDAFPDLAQNQIALTWISYAPPHTVNTGGGLSTEDFWKRQPPGASYRGVELIAPADLVNVYYLVAAQVWLEQGMTPPSAEIERAMAALTQPGSYDAASYILDLLSGTTGGPSLPAGPKETWESQRNLINRYFQSLQWPELRSVNLNQKLWQDGPYGRERDFLGQTLENRNRLTAEAIARLMHSIVGGVSVSAARSQAMMTLLRRDDTAQERDDLGQAGGIELGLPADARVWAVSGCDRHVRHEAGYIEVEGSHPYLLVILTEGNSDNESIIPFVAKQVLAAGQAQLMGAE